MLERTLWREEIYHENVKSQMKNKCFLWQCIAALHFIFKQDKKHKAMTTIIVHFSYLEF